MGELRGPQLQPGAIAAAAYAVGCDAVKCEGFLDSHVCLVEPQLRPQESP